MPWGPHAAKAFEDALGLAKRNADGYVVQIYDVTTDQMAYQFGHLRFVALTWEGKRYPDDPWLNRTEIPLSEVREYLETFYWPRGKNGPPPGWKSQQGGAS